MTKVSRAEVESSEKPLHTQESFMPRHNAALTSNARLRLAKSLVDGGWSVLTAAKMFMVSSPSAKHGQKRYRDHGRAGVFDSSTPPAMVKRLPDTDLPVANRSAATKTRANAQRSTWM
ncbi:MAG: leucine zipper domain-containing protein, partial [Micrococcaceae bacterium]|nr:leucine zipper domain-containing protein [Micrococcaceae bacterium]